MKSYAPEVIADKSGRWCGNNLRFATRDEALRNVVNFSFRWSSVTDIRVVESLDPINSRFVDGKLVALECK